MAYYLSPSFPGFHSDEVLPILAEGEDPIPGKKYMHADAIPISDEDRAALLAAPGGLDWSVFPPVPKPNPFQE